MVTPLIPLVHAEPTDSVTRFEQAIAQMHGAAGAVATNSGTSALHLALLALGVGPGDEVVIPSYSCVALLNAVRLAGAREVLVDNEYDPEHMAFNVCGGLFGWEGSVHPKALILPFMFGLLPNLARVQDWADFRGIPVIEDRAMALGCAAPLLGDMAVHSFHASKIISTGEGGMVVARTPEVLARLRDLNGYAAAVAADRLVEYPEYVPRVNYRMSEWAVSNVDASWYAEHALEARLWKRREIAAHYIVNLGLNIALPEGSVWGRFVFELPDHLTPGDFLAGMAERGVEAGRGVAPPLHRYVRLPGWEHSNAEKAYQRLGSLPLYPTLTDAQVEHITDAAKAVLGR